MLGRRHSDVSDFEQFSTFGDAAPNLETPTVISLRLDRNYARVREFMERLASVLTADSWISICHPLAIPH
jgi:hypothetical protein